MLTCKDSLSAVLDGFTEVRFTKVTQILHTGTKFESMRARSPSVNHGSDILQI